MQDNSLQRIHRIIHYAVVAVYDVNVALGW